MVYAPIHPKTTNLMKLHKKALKLYPESALVNWLATRYNNFEGMKSFASKFPELSASAHNALAYEYARQEIMMQHTIYF